MKVLITGGAGFIGTALALKLRECGTDVRIFDLAPSELEGVEQFRGSILDRHAIAAAAEGCDAIVHLAAMLGVTKTNLKRLECMNINIEGAVNVFEAAIRAGVKRIVFSSSSEVYGEPSEIPITEETPLNPKSVYATTKIAAEEYLRSYAQRYDLEYTIVRFFNVYGVGQVAEFVLPKFVKAALEGKAPVIYGDGSQVRSFCYMDDAVEGVNLILQNDKSIGTVFNIGNDEEPISIKDLAERTMKIAGVNQAPEYVELEQAKRETKWEILNRSPSIEKARKVLGYKPQVSLDMGIEKMLAAGNIKETWFERGANF